jgi:DNA modification methylase
MDKYWKMGEIKLIQGDCLEKMKDITDESVDLVVFDPPYFRCSKNKYDYIFSNKKEWISWMLSISEEAFRCLKIGGSFYVFGGIGTRNGFAFWNYIEQLSNSYTFCSYINWKRFRPKGYKGKHNNWGDCRLALLAIIPLQAKPDFQSMYLSNLSYDHQHHQP